MLPFQFWWEQSVHSTKCVYTRHPIMITDIILILINQNCLLTYKANSPTSGSNDGVYYPCVLQRHAALQRSFKAVKMPNRQQQVGRHDEFAIYVKKTAGGVQRGERLTRSIEASERASEGTAPIVLLAHRRPASSVVSRCWCFISRRRRGFIPGSECRMLTSGIQTAYIIASTG